MCEDKNQLFNRLYFSSFYVFALHSDEIVHPTFTFREAPKKEQMEKKLQKFRHI